VAAVWVGRIAARRDPGKAIGAIAFFNCLIVASAVAAPVTSGLIRDLSGSLSGAIFLGAGVSLLGPLLLSGVEDVKN
jgi:hypothetical protein